MPKSGTIPVSFARGINLRDDPRRIKDDELVKAQNLVPSGDGDLETRPALQRQEGDWHLGGDINRVLSHAVTRVPDLDGFIVNTQDLTATGDDIDGDVRWLAANGTDYNFSSLIEFNTENEMPVDFGLMAPYIFTFGSATYVLFGPDAAVREPDGEGSMIDLRDDWAFIKITAASGTAHDATSSTQNGSKIELAAWTENENFGKAPRVAASYRQRVVWANFQESGGTPGLRRTLVFSDDFNPERISDTDIDAFAANGRAIELAGAGADDEIVAMVEVMQTAAGTPAQTALLVLLRHSAYMITGEPDQADGTGTDDLQIHQFSVETGCVGSWAVAKTPYGVFWVGPDDVWQFEAGQLPRRVGSKLRPAIRRIGLGRLGMGTGYNHLPERVRVAYADDFLHVSLPGDGQVLTADDFGTEPMALEEEYVLYLAAGSPPDGESAAWYGPQLYPSYTNGAWTTGAPYWSPDLTTADNLTALVGTSTSAGNESVDQHRVEAASLDTLREDSGETTTDHGIEIDLKTKYYDAAAPSLKKLAEAAYANLAVYGNIGSGADREGTVKGRFNLWGDDTAYIMDADFGPATMSFPPENAEATAFYPDGDDRPESTFVQFELYTEDEQAVTVADGENQLYLWWQPDFPTTHISYLFTIPAGTYEDFDALAAAIQTAWRAADTDGEFDGATVTWNSGSNRFDFLVDRNTTADSTYFYAPDSVSEPAREVDVLDGVEIPGGRVLTAGEFAAVEAFHALIGGPVPNATMLFTNDGGNMITDTTLDPAALTDLFGPWLNITALDLILEVIPRTP